MAMKQIKLEIRNEKEEVVVKSVSFIPGRKIREALKIGAMSESADVDQVEILDTMVSFVAGLFKDLTEDDILDGIASWELMSELQRIMTEVLGGDTKETANL